MASIFRCLVGLAFLSQILPVANASDYPKSTIRIINASSVGGVSDIFVRSVAEELRIRLKQPIIIENRPGGAFNIATRACSDAAPDGYTFCALPSDVFIYNPYLFKTLPFDPDKAVDPIMALFFLPQVLAVKADLNINTIDQLVAASKAHPNTMSYVSPGIAQAGYVESFIKKEKGADLVKVPFRGGGDAVTGMMTGATPVAFIALGNLIPHLKAKTIVPIAQDGKERLSLFPSIPTVKETGFNGTMIQPFFALFAPTGTPQEIQALIRSEVAKIISEPSFRQRNILNRGLASTSGTVEELRQLIAAGRLAAKDIVAASGLQAQ
jgi:tripartite-type tricarboxylate transporter receptor subunit TctC